MPKSIKQAIHIVMNTNPHKNWVIEEIITATRVMGIRNVSDISYWIKAVAKEVKDGNLIKIDVDGVKNMYMGHKFQLANKPAKPTKSAAFVKVVRSKSPVKRSKSPVASSGCPPGKIRNPKTGRCVSRNGKIGRTLV
jgi:hypothetical protein